MRIIIVDSHSEIFPYWTGEYLRLKTPLVAVRIDEHHDMNHDSRALPAREGRYAADFLSKMISCLEEYSRRWLNEGNFTCPAFHYGILGALYHLNPREEGIDAYGRVNGDLVLGAPRTMEVSTVSGGRRRRWIWWDHTLTRLRRESTRVVPVCSRISREEFQRDLEGSRLPVAIGFDLDSLYGMKESASLEEALRERSRRVGVFLRCIPNRPRFVCISRSQRPRAYVPPDKVELVQEAALGILAGLHGES